MTTSPSAIPALYSLHVVILEMRTGCGIVTGSMRDRYVTAAGPLEMLVTNVSILSSLSAAVSERAMGVMKRTWNGQWSGRARVLQGRLQIAASVAAISSKEIPWDDNRFVMPGYCCFRAYCMLSASGSHFA